MSNRERFLAGDAFFHNKKSGVLFYYRDGFFYRNCEVLGTCVYDDDSFTFTSAGLCIPIQLHFKDLIFESEVQS